MSTLAVQPANTRDSGIATGVLAFALSISMTTMLTAGQREVGPMKTPSNFVVEATIRGTHAAFAAGQMSCVPLVREYLDRITAYDDDGPALKAIITINHRALEAAADMDRLYTANPSTVRPLHCIPVILKDNYDTAEMPTTGGSPRAEVAYAVSR